MPSEGSDAPVWDAERLRIATDAAGMGLWSWNVDTDAIALDERSRALWEVERDGRRTFADLSARIEPPDRERVHAAFASTRATPGPYQIDFRIRRDDGIRWISARGRGADEGIVGRIMFGAFLDSTARMASEEARELLASEMSHRVKNLFAIASSLVSIAARSAATTTEMDRDLQARLGTLGRAHDLIRPLPGNEAKGGAPLHDLFAAFLAPYDDKGSIGDRIRVSVPEVMVCEKAATTLALVVHELATNALKYGSLSAAAGTLDVSSTPCDGDVAIVWTERGGPPGTAPAGPGGFGSRLVFQSMTGQLAGSVDYDWQLDGVVITLRMSEARLVA